MKLTYDNLGFVPDFVWASPPCTTYSLMAGGTHNNPKEGLYEKTDTAREHAVWFTQLFNFLRWTKEHKEHSIFVIENPVGLLQNMPLMKEMEKEFGLHKCTVHYCAFERCDKKPTHLWTNVCITLCLPVSKSCLSQHMVSVSSFPGLWFVFRASTIYM